LGEHVVSLFWTSVPCAFMKGEIDRLWPRA
jgi:hypothetical protein